MRPSLNVLDPELIGRIVDEAKRVLATVGMEIRGPEMKRRLLEAGLPLNASGDRVLFPRDIVEQAIASAPQSFTLYDVLADPFNGALWTGPPCTATCDAAVKATPRFTRRRLRLRTSPAHCAPGERDGPAECGGAHGDQGVVGPGIHP